MMRWILSTAMLLGFGFSQAQASELPILLPEQTFSEVMAIDWKVGNNADYSVDMGFIKGTMNILVRERVSEGIWVEQNMDLGFMGKQKIEILHDANDGRVKKLIVNGQEQDPPKNTDQEVEEMKEDTVTVPAGTFRSVYIRVRDNSKNQTSEAWINPQEVPAYGLIKQVAPSQFGEIVIELTKFSK